MPDVPIALVGGGKLLKPTQIAVTTLDGDVLYYTISRFPAVAGREILAKYPLTAVPKLADYSTNEEVMLKLMGYVAVEISNQNPAMPANFVALSTKALVDNHVPDFETLVQVEIEMIKYNTSFFRQGVALNFLNDIVRKLSISASPTLTKWLAQLLAVAKQRSGN
jgi:hypothetical protein